MDTVKILCICGDDSLQATIDGAIASAGRFAVERVAHLAAARLHLQGGGVHLIVAHLAGGCPMEEFVAFVRERRTCGAAVPILAIDETNDLERRVELLRLKVVDCLPRPLNITRFEFLIQSLTSRPRCELAPPSQGPVPRCLECSRPPEEIASASPDMRRLLQQLRAVAPLETTILLTGETGGGKTHMARLIHEMSPRRDKPLVVVQCSALSATLLQSELFGHVKGAFTGADCDRRGLFAAAEGGTILLDDIDCIPLDAQASLLRVVEDRVFEPVGSSRPHPSQARLIAATNRVLEEDVAAKRFRSDLFHRLNVLRFALPPLRERRADIQLLARNFLERFCSRSGRELLQLSGDVSLALETYDWPGNVRELRNVIERGVALCATPVLELSDLPESIQAAYRVRREGLTAVATSLFSGLASARKDGERNCLLDALHRNNNNRVRTAAELRISRVTLYRKLREFGIR